MTGFEHLLDVVVEAEVEWGPDPDEVAALAAHLAAPGGADLPPARAEEAARAALVFLHERQQS